MASSKKFVPGSGADAEEIFTYPFLILDDSKELIKLHGRIMFIIRGPPGTAKKSLTDLIKNHFPKGVRCSADEYFSNTFNSPVRSPESLKESHLYCHKRVKQECTKNTHPVIVSNTHMRKNEIQEYLNIAAEYAYTVLIISTVDKFKVSPEILAKTNTKGLDKNYFQKRLKMWQEVFPVLLGWFLCVDDSFFILEQLKIALDSLLGDGKFCRIFNVFDSDSLFTGYKAKTMLYCTAGFMKNTPFELKDYYKSEEVRDSYGKCFPISIQAFVVTNSNIFAVVHLSTELKNLIPETNFENYYHEDGEHNHVDSLVNSMESMFLKSQYNFKFVPLKNDFSAKPKTALLEESSCDHFNLNECSFIHIAQKEEKPFSAQEVNKSFRKAFKDVVDESGDLKADEFNELGNGYLVYRLSEKGWMIKPSMTVTVKAVFTGLYQ